LGKIIEAKAKFSAKDSLFRLNRALPRRGRKRLEDGRYAYVSIKEIYPGDVVMAVMGEKIVLDGCVIDGEGTCDESLMTGEASPISKRLGDIVLGGTCVTHGWIAYKVSAGVEQSALQRIIQLIEQDIGHKSHYMRMTDPIIRWFVPIILVIASFSALGVWFFYGNEAAIIRFVSVLLISCPCAIGIAAPLAEAHLMNGLTKLGAIVRNRGCLRFLGQETLFVFDKTGTLTEGHFQVLKGDEPLSSFELSIVKAVASHSNHPIARAIASFIESEPIHLTKIEEFAGKGLRGEYQNEIYYLGSAEFLQSQGIVPSSVSTEGLTSCVYFADHRKVITCFELGDQIKTNASEVISQLPRSLLLSGDSKGAVEVVAKACGFEEFYWSRSPLLKREAIEGLKKKGEIVCMIGDGINDAPSLTSAHIGISVISATDISIQVSDILLTTDKLDVIPKIRKMAQKGRRVIRQNLFWAFFYNVIGVGLAVCGLLTPLFAAFAMVASSLIVLFNSQRIKVR
jgi:heavy metal translocating P-type ATPase